MAGFGGFRAPGGDVNHWAYIGAKVRGRFNAYEAGVGLFFGRTCDAAVIRMIDPDVATVLEKAVGRAPEGRSYFAGVFGGGAGRNPDAYYLDGFGALFLLRVDFPLAAPVEAKAEEGPAATDRTWEATRRELREGTAGDPPIWDVLGARAFHGEFPEYDGGRVGELRGALVQSLRHASNLAVLKPEETVAVTVFGPPAGREDRPVKAGKRRGTGAGAGDGPEDDAAKGTTLTLRARKADIDAFAGGKLTPEEFAKRVRETLR